MHRSLPKFSSSRLNPCIQQRQEDIVNRTGRLERAGSILHRTRSRIKLPLSSFPRHSVRAMIRQQTESGSKQFTVEKLQGGRTQEDLISSFDLHCSGCAILGSRWCQEYRLLVGKNSAVQKIWEMRDRANS